MMPSPFDRHVGQCPHCSDDIFSRDVVITAYGASEARAMAFDKHSKTCEAYKAAHRDEEQAVADEQQAVAMLAWIDRAEATPQRRR